MPIRIFTLTILSALLFCAVVAEAQDAMPPADWQQSSPEIRIAEGLTLMTQGDMDGAFKTLFGKGHNKEVLDKLKFELYSLTKKGGNPYAFEKVLEQKAGSSTLRYRYLLLFEAQPVMFDFYYFKSPKGWSLKNISYSKDIKKIFER